jgi:uncharacterized protein YndB with AHSA1/START domain
MRSIALVLLAAAFALPATASAAVVDVKNNGFKVSNSSEISAPPAKVWAALVQPGRWWNREHSWFGDPSRDFKLDLRPGGCFCEIGPRGQALHMTVVMVQPDAELHLSGALGPLHQEGVTGGLVFKLEPVAGGATKLTATYTVGGYFTGGGDAWAKPVDSVLAEQVQRLERLVETGSPEPKR